MYSTQLFDFEAVAECYKIICGEGTVTEIRVLEATTKGDRWPRTYSGYFDNSAAIVKALGDIETHKGCFFTFNPVKPALLAKTCNRLKAAGKGDSTGDLQIVSRRWLPIDCDAIRESGISSTDAEHEHSLATAEEVRDYLTSLGWSDPIMADSGNGAHLLYPIDLPVEDGGLVQQCMTAIAQRFPARPKEEREADGLPDTAIDLTVFNPSRIWKLYGSLVCKGDSTPDRPYRFAKVLSFGKGGDIVTREQLEALAAMMKVEEPAKKTSTCNGSSVAEFDIEGFIRRHHLDVSEAESWSNKAGNGRKWSFNQSPMCEHHGDGPFICQLGSGAISAGCHHNSCKGRWGWNDLRERLEPKSERVKKAVWGADSDLREITRKSTGNENNQGGQVATLEPVVVRLGDVQPTEVQFLWDKRIALGKLTSIAGDPGLGKSFLTLDMAARVTRGRAWPDGAPCICGSVILLTAEDDLSDTIRPRLDAAGADVDKIVAVPAIRGKDGDGEYDRSVDLTRDIARVEEVAEQLGDCRLIIIDPISCYLGDTKSHDNASVRAVLAPLAEMAGRIGAAVVAVSHLRKGDGPAMYRTMGSLAFVAAARAAYAVSKDPEDSTGRRRLFLPIKNNIGNDETGLAYHLQSHGCVASVYWHEDVISMSADDALETPKKRGRPAESRNEAIDFLTEALAGGPRLAKEVIEEAREVHGITKRTLDRARQGLKVKAERETPTGPWMWSLPDSFGNLSTHIAKSSGHIATDSYTQEFWHSGNLEENTGNSALSPDGVTPTLPHCHNSNVWDESGILATDGEAPCDEFI
jgi:hypothetical protein